MRALMVIAASVVGLVAGPAAVRAADVPIESSGPADCCYVADPNAPVVIYDDEPGVTMRRWWLPPWRDRHYYPHGRERLRTGDSSDDDQPRAQARPKRAPSYARRWTNPRARVRTPATLLTPNGYPAVQPNPYNYMPPVVVVPTTTP